jgi:hypothetical protein
MVAAAPPLSAGRLPRFDSSPDSSGFLEEVVTNPRYNRNEMIEGGSTAVMAAAELPEAAHPSDWPRARPLSAVPPPSVPPPPKPLGRSSPPAPIPLPSATGARRAVSAFRGDESPNPAPETILEHLARVGVFEKGGGAAPAWEAAARERSRGALVLIAAMVLSVGAGAGGFFYARQVKNERMAHARTLQTEVETLLRTGRTDDLRATDEKLSEVFDLDSRSQHAALLWLRNRVLSALLLPGEAQGIESALHRCETVGCDPARIAFGRVASFLSEGDYAGAAALLPKWDDKAKKDAYYQFTAGAMLERAGDVRSIGRYKKAFELDDTLLIARVLHGPLVALELGLDEALPFLEVAKKRLGDRPTAKALEGLEWALSADRSDATPAELVMDASETEELPVPLRSIPLVVEALGQDPGSDEARAKLDAALRVAATPAVATWIGFVVINSGDEELARKATLRALAHSALYPRARALAARVALLGARLEDASKAIQELDPNSAEVAVVRAATAYEMLDSGELESAVAAMGEGAEERAASRALSRGLDLVMGKKYPDAEALEAMAVPGVPWGSIVAVDAALDQGDLELAKRVVDGWKGQEEIPVYAVRVARLARYANEPAAAVDAVDNAIVPGGVTPRALVEAVYALVAAERSQTARELVAKYPAVLGPLTDWLKVVIDVAEGNEARAKTLAARLEPLPYESPLLLHVMMARALAAVGDTRAKAVIATALARSRKHPDLLEAGRALGIVR